MKEAYVSYKTHFLFTITYHKDREQVITVEARKRYLFSYYFAILTKITFFFIASNEREKKTANVIEMMETERHRAK